jgi:DNA polymerase (family 10)
VSRPIITNAAAADRLAAYADLLELQGEQPFRLRAYRRAADSLRQSPQSLAELAAAGTLRHLAGVGPAIEGKLRELVERGSFHQYDELVEQLPPSLLGLLEVPEIGPRTAMRLYRELGIADVEALAAAAHAGRLRQLSGFTARSEARLLAGIAELNRHDRRRPLGQALPAAEALLAQLTQHCPQLAWLATTGSLRRLAETVGDIDLIAAAADPAAALDCFASLPGLSQFSRSADWHGRAVTAAGLPVELLVTTPDRYGALQALATGDAEHRRALQARAEARGLTFHDQALYQAERQLATPDEADCYAALGLACPPPELRQGAAVLTPAEQGRLPVLIELADLHGDLHCHSTWSDGGASIETMARAAQARGYQYLAITDHSIGLGITNGLDATRLRQQRAELDALQPHLDGIRLLQGVELEIRADGSLPLPDDCLAELDLVVASLHVSLRQPRAQITERLLRAIHHPLVDIIGHPTGRIIGRRAGADLDLPVIFAACAATGTALEISADPARLDLSAEAIPAALAAGVALSLNCDAHHPDGFANARYGIAQARRGWAPATAIINTRPLPALLAGLKRHRRP